MKNKKLLIESQKFLNEIGSKLEAYDDASVHFILGINLPKLISLFLMNEPADLRADFIDLMIKESYRLLDEYKEEHFFKNKAPEGDAKENWDVQKLKAAAFRSRFSPEDYVELFGYYFSIFPAILRDKPDSFSTKDLVVAHDIIENPLIAKENVKDEMKKLIDRKLEEFLDKKK